MTDRVIEIRLRAPRPNLLQLLAQPEFGLVRAGVGTGPFRRRRQRSWRPSPPGICRVQACSSSTAFAFPMREDPIEKVRISWRRSRRKLVAAFAKGELDLVLGGTVADLPYAWQAKVPRGRAASIRSPGLFGLVPTAAERSASRNATSAVCSAARSTVRR